MDLSSLSLEQRYAFLKFCSGENVFLTGPGGTGKTKLIEFIVSQCKKNGKTYQVTAMTGCAATLLPPSCGARTLHSWSGIGICKGENEKIVQRVLRKKTNRQTWRKTDVLIVDEVSMMSKKIITILDEVARTARLRTNVPFGGMQVVFSGDFLQLPPIPNPEDKDSSKFCFESRLWESIFPYKNNVELRKIFRQSDPIYQSILLEVRKGSISESNAEILQSYVQRSKENSPSNNYISKLYPVRWKTEALNNQMYKTLTSQEYVFNYERKSNCSTRLDSGKALSVEDIMKCEDMTKQERDFEFNSLLNTSNYAEELCLKEGCTVMCTVNLDMDNGICNGSQGKIIGFTSNSHNPQPIVRFHNNIVRTIEIQYRQSEEYPCLAVAQIPLILAWGMTIHKIQGATLDEAEIDIGSSVFENGQTYVALSRIKSLDGLYLSAFRAENIRANEKALAYYKELQHLDYEKELEILEAEQSKLKSVGNDNPFAEFELKEDSYETPEPAPVSDVKDVSFQPMNIQQHMQMQAASSKPKVRSVQSDKGTLGGSGRKTWTYYLENKSLDEIAEIRGLKKSTILQHIVDHLPDDRAKPEDLICMDTYREIKQVYDIMGNEPLSVIKQQLRYSISYNEIKIVRAFEFGNQHNTKEVIL